MAPLALVVAVGDPGAGGGQLVDGGAVEGPAGLAGARGLVDAVLQPAFKRGVRDFRHVRQVQVDGG